MHEIHVYTYRPEKLLSTTPDGTQEDAGPSLPGTFLFPEFTKFLRNAKES